MKYDESKIEELVKISNKLSEKGFGTSTSGNCSVRGVILSTLHLPELPWEM